MKRRNLLKKVGAAGVFHVGATGLASSKNIDQPDVESETLRAVLDDQEELLNDLAADGIIDSPSADEFDLQTVVRPGTRESGVFVAPAWFDGVRKQVVTIGRTIDEGFLKITYDPETELVVTDLRTTDGEVNRYGDDIGTLSCSSDSDCGDCETCVCTCDSCGPDCCEGTTCTCEDGCL